MSRKTTYDFMNDVMLCAWDHKFREEVTLGEFTDRIEQFLSGFQKLVPSITQFYESGRRPNNVTPIAPDFSNLRDCLRRTVYDRKEKYSEMGPDGLPTLNATAKRGYHCGFINQPKENAASAPIKLGISLSTGWGEGFGGCCTIIYFPQASHPEFNDVELQKAIFRLIFAAHQVDDGVVYSPAFANKIPDNGNVAERIMRIGTVNYFRDKRVADALPEDIEREPFGEGVLVITSRQRPDPGNARQVHDATRVRDALHAKGLLRYPPPSEF
jgi:hypothetical protein